MGEETNAVRRTRGADAPIDAVDRRILGVLVDDASVSYARIGEIVHLSAPAVHERVKRLRRRGAIRGTVARLDAEAVGKPLLAFVHVDSDGWGASQEIMTIRELPEVEEIHSVTGDSCLVVKVRTQGPEALEEFLRRLYAMPGVRSTRSHVVLSSYLERGVRPDESLAGASADASAGEP